MKMQQFTSINYLKFYDIIYITRQPNQIKSVLSMPAFYLLNAYIILSLVVFIALILLNSQVFMHSEEKSYLQHQFYVQNQDPNFRSDHSFYGLKSGEVSDPSACLKYKIDDPNSQTLFQNATFFFKDAPTCFKEKSIDIFVKENFTPSQLQDSIQKYASTMFQHGDKFFQEYKSKANDKVKLFSQRFGTNSSDSYGCCLALSYYTGVHSQRMNRSSNIVIKLDITEYRTKIVDSAKFKWMKCIGYWMFKALHYIPLHWGQVIRCVSLKPGQDSLYTVGSIVTWLQFSSSSYGQPTDYFKGRNTRFFIYSLSGRNIQHFSNYGNENQVLFKPFSHFLVLYRQQKEEVLFIYMREIFFGQSYKNILWVDDNIFDPQWQNKDLMERAVHKEPLLNIIPKISTEAALAFVRSELCRNRKANEFRIVSDMTRINEKPSHNAGARFVKQLLPIYNNLKILIFTGNRVKGQDCLKEQGISSMENIVVTTVPGVALKFLRFN